VTEEEPFLFTDSGGNFDVFVPAVQHGSSGTSWASGQEAGTTVPLSKFFVASPGMSGAAITAALAQGKDLILSPGVYNLDQPIVVPHPDTVVLGLGLATLVPQHGNAAMIVVRNSGVKLSGLIIDAGPVNSPVLLSVGTPRTRRQAATPTSSRTCTSVSAAPRPRPPRRRSACWTTPRTRSSTTCGPGAPTTANAVGWTKNTGNTGLVVTGSGVTAYGLAVEHYQKNEVIWSGQGGTDIFFQNELPYDPPSQADWMASPTQNGYPRLPGQPQRQDLPGLRHGQLRRVHPDHGHAARRRGRSRRRTPRACSSTTRSAYGSADPAGSTPSLTASAAGDLDESRHGPTRGPGQLPLMA